MTIVDVFLVILAWEAGKLTYTLIKKWWQRPTFAAGTIVESGRGHPNGGPE